jgi:hypothetical protein
VKVIFPGFYIARFCATARSKSCGLTNDKFNLFLANSISTVTAGFSGGRLIIGISDYRGRDQYRRHIHELEQRRSQLRARMYEVLAAD